MTAVSYNINISYKSCDGQFQISSCKLHGPNFIAVRLGGRCYEWRNRQGEAIGYCRGAQGSRAPEVNRTHYEQSHKLSVQGRHTDQGILDGQSHLLSCVSIFKDHSRMVCLWRISGMRLKLVQHLFSVGWSGLIFCI